MPNESELPADKQLIYLAQFNTRTKVYLKSLITPELIEEHRLKPLGQHSDNLERMLNFFRRPPSFGLYSSTACSEYQVIALPITPGAIPEPLYDVVFHDENEALHAVFLKHVENLRAQ